MPYVENLDEFSIRQDCPYMRVNERLIFENGATWYDGSFGKQFGYDPPNDPVALAQLRGEFLGVKLAHLRRTQNDLRNTVAAQTEFYGRGCGPSPDYQFPLWREQLTALSEDIEAAESELEALKRKYSRAERENAYDQRRAAERHGAAEILQTLKDLT